MEELLKDLKKKVWITKCCRFNASKRYGIHNIYANLSTAILACYVVILNICQLVITVQDHVINNRITAITIGISVFLLAITLYIWARDFSVKAVSFHDCGRDLASFESKIDILLAEKTNNITKEQIEELSREYNTILNRYENHENIDLLNLYNECKSDFPERVGKSECWYNLKVKVDFFFQVYFVYFLLLIGIPLVSILLLFV
ncbi:SLATT domain-containing protein [Parabacteroides sp. OttesenSCG-928-O15]|nr:SLATT domain-containing protein [Parabacteroides sp. OttesenSCG-928-O15]